MMNLQNELTRIDRVSDQMCSSHAWLHNRYKSRSLYLNLAILSLSLWIVTTVFIDPMIEFKLTPFGLNPIIWSGLLAICNFLLSIVQLKVNWSGLAQSHEQASKYFSEVKQSVRDLRGRNPSESDIKNIIDRYKLGSKMCISIPEKLFLKTKRHHKMKVLISKHLDANPSTPIFLAEIYLCVKDFMNIKDIGSGNQD